MRCAYVLILMVIFWTFEPLPVAMTSMIPVVLYPMLSIVKASEISPKYLSEANMTLVGTIFVITEFEKVGLHKRVAFLVLKTVGTKPRFLLAGFMIIAWFLSMWCSNTMSAVLLIPIVSSVSDELKKATDRVSELNHLTNEHGSPMQFSLSETADDCQLAPQQNKEILKKDAEKCQIMLLLGIAFSASIGGSGTLIGTGPNLIMKEESDVAFDHLHLQNPLNFLTWMIYAIPLSFSLLVFLWIWMLIYKFGFKYAFGCSKSPLDDQSANIEPIILHLADDIPPMSTEHYIVGGHCLMMMILLITRKLSSEPLIGWEILAPDFVKESTAAMLVAISLYIVPVAFPSKCPKSTDCRGKKRN